MEHGIPQYGKYFRKAQFFHENRYNKILAKHRPVMILYESLPARNSYAIMTAHLY